MPTRVLSAPRAKASSYEPFIPTQPTLPPAFAERLSRECFFAAAAKAASRSLPPRISLRTSYAFSFDSTRTCETSCCRSSAHRSSPGPEARTNHAMTRSERRETMSSSCRGSPAGRCAALKPEYRQQQAVRKINSGDSVVARRRFVSLERRGRLPEAMKQRAEGQRVRRLGLTARRGKTRRSCVGTTGPLPRPAERRYLAKRNQPPLR